MTKCKMWKIQVWNSDIHNGWKDYRAAGLFHLKSAAEAEAYRLRHIWTSMFKKDRVVPWGAREHQE